MKTLTSTLRAAQQSPSSQPYVEAKVDDYWGEMPRLRLTRFYTGVEANGYVAAVVAPDGSLVRARLEDTGATSTLYVSRVTSPGSGSTYGSWTTLVATVSGQAGVALCVEGSTIYLLYVDTDDVSIKVRTSSDDGATWSSASAVLTAGGSVGAIAACGNGAGDILLIWAEGATVFRSRYSAGAWGSRTAWTRSVASISGLAVCYRLDWQVVVTGTEVTTLNPRVYSLRYGDGWNQASNTWGTLREVMAAEAGSDVTFAAPAVVEAEGFRLFFVESYAGDANYDRLHYASLNKFADFNDEQWREPLPLDYEGNVYGAAAAYDGSGGFWLASSDGVWYAAIPAYAEADLSADVVEAKVDQDGRGARVQLVLDNSAGSYDAYGSGALGALQRGGRLKLTPGYATSAGNEAPLASVYWIESIERVTLRQAQGERGTKRLVVHARDGWWLLERWRARRQFSWAAGERALTTILSILTYRVGLHYAPFDVSASMSGLSPAFTVQAGESAATAIRRLLAMVPDVGFFTDQNLRVTEPAADDTSTYSLGDGAHMITEAVYRDVGPASNLARIVGDGVYAQAFDFGEIESAGELVAQVVDRNLDDSGDATTRAAAVLRDAAIDARTDQVTLFGVHCGVEVYDVVDVTDPQAGLTAAPRRVLGFSWRFETLKRQRYDMTLTLGAT